jgi:hypothetical protein
MKLGMIFASLLIVGCSHNTPEYSYPKPDPKMGRLIDAASYQQASSAAFNSCMPGAETQSKIHPLLYCTCVSQSVVSNISRSVGLHNLQYERDIIPYLSEMFLTQEQVNKCYAAASPRLVRGSEDDIK